MSVEVLSDSLQAARAVRRALGLAASCSTSSSQYEVLRATVWSVAAPNGEVHVNRVLAAALPTWRLLSERGTASEETLRAELRAALATLEDAGDLLRRRGGYWGAATARLVDLPNGLGCLIIGGVPSSLLPIDADAVDYHGPHRHLAKSAAELRDVLPAEEFASWSRRPDVELQDWALELIESLERQAYSPTNVDPFEFYMPASARFGAPQFRRWSESAGPGDATLLARRTRIYGAREHRLVDVRGGKVVGTRDLQGIDVRRLMYALDLAAMNPVRARSIHGSRTEWLFTSELPRAEQRTFAAFGTLAVPADRPFERHWAFSRNEDLALSMLRALGITLEER